ncbi:protein tyrosine phosphatase 2 [Anticarsia gemmatalis multiple nucleopolyhedrovirus]|uniref:Protein tyrosine phosphatase 2 n=1 Tax=Anticarsia gemmatalis multiple nucleopolyhedrovirus TaxID=268591 RepID=A0A0S3IYD1_9ABAC|nr:protein tyrosine phosphatase 2 [Anticarsia gemmatalis multiple nucleopolyhedrovirus]ALR70277.1 protein tyrosine phosphatase 2 [Anticarsia gemmatalis multiple nucleopolyhedrovirus]ALR70590.1 protein tyrosine phosphatase 2 [Anticarsia gemmatalis multiple nucleopolyhedrovirus]ALR70747.1 protein tyrosine phosphatase 2 [Anticarsia gemmatalis multiple nucleopolyhedrovirus]ALR71691.1 protein tyrosine phosphatase 2 [Anticarsia gemmatalis multiple nucleopolyhedrovirus]ALR71847.1 protein tyrosine pho
MYDANQIDENLFVGGYYGDNEAMLQFITKHDIESVISLIDSDVGPIRQALGLPAGYHIHVYCENKPTCMALINAIDALYDYIERRINEGKKILIHCHAGVSRSATLAVYYYMKKWQMSYEEALRFVNNKRNVALSDHFVRFLSSRCIYRFVDNKLKIQVN